jgi:Phage shock protein A (IM30), suppresses sigma54-dependent transcription
MLRRFWTVLRSIFGSLLRRAEDPELLLRQYIDDMRSKLPPLRATVAEVVATEIQLQKQVDRLRDQIADFDQQITAALRLGPEYEEEARTLIAAKAMAEEGLEDTLTQLETAQKASRQAKAALEDYQHEMERKVTEAKQLIGQAKLAGIQEELAQTMAAFEVRPPSDVLERMREKVDERTAQAKARAEVVMSGVDARLREIRRASAQIGVDQQLAEYKRRLGLPPATEPSAPSAEAPGSEQTTRSVQGKKPKRRKRGL